MYLNDAEGLPKQVRDIITNPFIRYTYLIFLKLTQFFISTLINKDDSTSATIKQTVHNISSSNVSGSLSPNMFTPVIHENLPFQDISSTGKLCHFIYII